MIYIKDNSDFEPDGYTPFKDQYTVFADTDAYYDEDYTDVIGTANLLIDNIDGRNVRIYINYIESYHTGCHRVINYLMNLYEKVTIAGESYNDITEFWRKLGADLDEDALAKDSDLIYFEIRKENFKNTKYYKEL